MGEGWEGNEASGGENGCEAHHVGISPQKDCSRSKSEMGEGTGGAEEGSLKEMCRPEPAMRRGRKTAKVAMARRLAVRLYWM